MKSGNRDFRHRIHSIHCTAHTSNFGTWQSFNVRTARQLGFRPVLLRMVAASLGYLDKQTCHSCHVRAPPASPRAEQRS